MLYPIGIEMGDEKHAYGVVVPDVPGCFSAGDTLEEAFTNAKEAIAFHIEGMLEDGEEIPLPTDLQRHMQNKEYEGFTFTVVDVDLTHLMGKAEKINVTLPKILINKIDNYVSTHPQYKSRSGFLAQIATDKLLSA
ncbi:type II toxin-antitoxin system HicB family antitoxin [Avibacterium paragallinarum]|uniref:Type II toxin-antitoxin system HicB family antitoxin n=1 Tax=Avibacterium paragallinarum TaxID=728 RepID=A0A2S5AX18_AVIPA|nr:type II toxin-antitoxin system HicB family antitoxin [Avibacterium paragallinarum]MEE3608243.1 type II toxin-antitoxin system HicB family antitoxin [Avibacterium paragallinarum]MEE3622337.1 type II toxin-antitoxin system HicB family antitoxin [Avibacterium paragallinarum]MEE3668392.1 type II toxin-antitoxin system HicB family antitoxin [Avibacterium paragallinarum]MEE3680402.1 type II toxin-antitoxin system HicB family antitoxin [Avibacterium paragallinarum]MEE4385939.1 type II toxin-antito